MALSPVNAERSSAQGFQRSFTLPARSLSIHEKAGLDRNDATADILYSHPQARIFSFSPPKESIKSKTTTKIPPDTDYPVDTVETLPWRSRTETTAAAGRLMIEKVRGSTNFLKCQDIMHAILRNSQCWCVDGESKFVLRVRAFQYYRIELPSASEEDKGRVEELKKVLPTVLRYERTPCPFVRAFHVDLPDDAITPRRKGAWKRRDSSQPNTPETDTPPIRVSKTARSWSLRSPPSSYPKSGPSHTGAFPDVRPSTSAGSNKKDSLRELTRRPPSPASSAASDDGPDMEKSYSEYGQGQESDSEESPESPIVENSRGRQTTVAAREARSISVSARVAAFETVRTASVTRPRLEQEISATNAIMDVRPQAKSPYPATSPLRESQSPSPGFQETEQEPSAAQDSGLSNSKFSSRVMNYSADGDPSDTESGNNKDKSVSQPESNILVKLDATSPNQLPPLIVSDEDSADIHEIIQDDHVLAISGVGPSLVTEEERRPKPLMLAEQASKQQNEHDTGLRLDLPDGIESGHDPQTDVVMAMQRPNHELARRNDQTQEANLSEHDMTIGSPSRGVMGEADAAYEDYTRNDNNDSDEDDLSTVSSVNSFHTMTSDLDRSYSDHEPNFSKTPRAEEQNPFSNLTYQHRRGDSEMTVTASAVSDMDALDAGTPLPRNFHVQPEGIDSSALDRALSNTMTTTGPIDTGVRQRLTGRRSFSPLPPASTLLTDHRQQSKPAQQLTRTILQKVIIKPIEVVTFIVKVLSRIAGGATVSDLLSGELFRETQHRRRVSDIPDRNDDLYKDDDTDDDYGVPIRGRTRSTAQSDQGVAVTRTNRDMRDDDADSFISVD